MLSIRETGQRQGPAQYWRSNQTWQDPTTSEDEELKDKYIRALPAMRRMTHQIPEFTQHIKQNELRSPWARVFPLYRSHRNTRIWGQALLGLLYPLASFSSPPHAAPSYLHALKKDTVIPAFLGTAQTRSRRCSARQPAREPCSIG